MPQEPSRTRPTLHAYRSVQARPRRAFVPLGRAALHAAVEAQLRRYIVQHGLRPGDRLPTEAELAGALATSRVVVREALRSLEAIGLVEARVGSGRYLRAFDVSNAARAFAQSLAFHPTALLDLLVVRRGTEVEVVRSLPGQLERAELDALDALVDQMARRVARGEPNFPVEDAAFHRRLMAGSGNQVALALLDLYWRVMDTLYQRGFPGPSASDSKQVIEAHRDIVAALRRGDREAASRTLRTHHEEAERRFASWRAAQAALPENGSHDALLHAFQEALLWPASAAAAHRPEALPNGRQRAAAAPRPRKRVGKL